MGEHATEDRGIPVQFRIAPPTKMPYDDSWYKNWIAHDKMLEDLKIWAPKQPLRGCIMKEEEYKILRACQGSGGVFLAHQLKEMSEEQHRAIYKPMNKNIRRNGRDKCE